MLEMVTLQNVVVEHKRKLAIEISAKLTDQVRALGLSDAKVWVSFEGLGTIEEVGQYPHGCTHAEADLVSIKRPAVRGKKKSPRRRRSSRTARLRKKLSICATIGGGRKALPRCRWKRGRLRRPVSPRRNLPQKTDGHLASGMHGRAVRGEVDHVL